MSDRTPACRRSPAEAAIPAPVQGRSRPPAIGVTQVVAACAFIAVLAGCASSDGIRSTGQTVTPAELGLQSPQVRAAPLAPAPDWWHALGSAQLDALVDKALEGSPSLAQVQARLVRAQALAEGARASAGVQVQGAIDATRQRYSANSIYPAPLGGSTRNLATAQIGAAWEFDFFGRNRAAIAAAVGARHAAEAELQAARVVLASQVVRGYVQVGRLTALGNVARSSLRQREHLRDLIRQRVQAGLDTAVEARQGDAALPEARLQIEQIDEQLRLARHALATLTAQPPDALDTLTPDLAGLRRLELPQAVGADLLGRRADITAARWRVEAAASEIALARALFYPNVNLNAFIGLSSLGLGTLIQADSMQLGVGPAIRLPIFDAGRLRANLGVKTAELDGAIASYNATVRDALRDAVDQLARLRSLVRQQREQSDTHALTQAAYDLVVQRYGAGLSSYLAVLQAESQLLAQRRLAADQRARVLDTEAALAQALGGGYAGDTRLLAGDAGAP